MVQDVTSNLKVHLSLLHLLAEKGLIGTAGICFLGEQGQQGHLERLGTSDTLCAH